MINANIPLSGRGVQTGNALISAGQAADQRKQAELNRSLTQENIQSRKISNESGQINNKNAADQREMFSITKGAIDTLGYIEGGDIDGLKNYYAARKAEIDQRGGNSSDTDAAMQLLESGDIESLAGKANQILQGAEKLGLIKPAQNGASLSKSFQQGVDEKGNLVFFRGNSGGGVERLDGISPVDPVQQKVTQQTAIDTQTPSGQASLEVKQAQADKSRADAEAKQKEVSENREKGIQIKQTALGLVDELLSDRESTLRHFGKDGAVPFTVRPSSRSSEAKLDQLRSILTSENLGIMSGVLSESDMKVIAAIAGGGLDSRLSDEEALKNLNELRRKFQNQVGGQSNPGSLQDLSDDELFNF